MFQFCDSMDAYARTEDILGKWVYNSGLSFEAGAGKYGGVALSGTQGYGRVGLAGTSIPAGVPTYVAGWWKFTSGLNALTSGVGMVVINTSMVLHITSGGTIGVYDTNRNLKGQGSRSISDSAYHWIEAAITVDGANSKVTVYVDGLKDIDGTFDLGVAAAPQTMVGLGVGTVVSKAYMDDVIVWDNQSGDSFTSFPIGIKRIGLLNPNGPGASTKFVSSDSTKANWQVASQPYVPVLPAVVATLSDAGIDNIDLYTANALGFTPTGDLNVVVSISGSNPSGDGAHKLGAVVQSNALQNAGLRQNLGSTPLTRQTMFMYDPATNPWTLASVNNIQIGMKD
ncbi:hypothetical protein [Burkholderia phage BCSR5]|nr:hypothetical protein [Burkholderia phage BCSR5]